jgi:hypothetical protein
VASYNTKRLRESNFFLGGAGPMALGYWFLFRFAGLAFWGYEVGMASNRMMLDEGRNGGK